MRKRFLILLCMAWALWVATPTLAGEVFLSSINAPYEPLQDTGIADDIKIRVSDAIASSYQYREEIAKSFDGDYTTMYHSVWTGVTYPITMLYDFSDVGALDYIVYHPRQSGTNGLFRKVDICVRYQGTGYFIKVMEKDFLGDDAATRVDFEPALQNVAAVMFVVNSSVSDKGMAFASCAEMEFYRKPPDRFGHSFDPLSLFTDASCSDLKPEVGAADIEACPNPFFKSMAHAMRQGIYPRDFRIASYGAYPDPSEDAAINKIEKRSRFDNPTGIAVEKGEELIVFVSGMESDYSVRLKIQDLDGESKKANYYNNGASYPLSNGVNKITVDNAGLAYVLYFRSDYAAAPKLKIHFATGTVNGYYDSRQHTEEQWSALLADASYKYFDVLGKSAHLTFPTESFREHTKARGRELIDLYDSLVYLEESFMGLLPEPNGYGYTAHSHPLRNRVYLVVIYDSYMNAAAYRTAYNVGTMNAVCSVAALKNESGRDRDVVWGPAHEIGHIHQTRPAFAWLGMTEVTNNLHSLYVQTHLHGNHNPLVNTRLQAEPMGEYVNRYEKAANQYFVEKPPHNHPDMDVFCKLVPLWQLHLYLTGVAEKTGRHGAGFYEDVYQAMREDVGDAGRTNGERQLEFVKTVCRTAQLNLEDFFTSYGFLTPIDTIVFDYIRGEMKIAQQQIAPVLEYIRQWEKPEKSKEFQYITDENVALYKSGGAVTAGTGTYETVFSVLGKFTFTGGENVVAYELYSSDGALKRVFLNTAAPVQYFRLPSGMAFADGDKVYAVGVNGDRVEVEVAM
jgi:hypothetical protein